MQSQKLLLVHVEMLEDLLGLIIAPEPLFDFFEFHKGVKDCAIANDLNNRIGLQVVWYLFYKLLLLQLLY